MEDLGYPEGAARLQFVLQRAVDFASHLSPFLAALWSCGIILCWTLGPSWIKTRRLLVPMVTLRAKCWPKLTLLSQWPFIAAIAPSGSPHGHPPFTLPLTKVWMACLSLSCWSVFNSPTVS